MFQYLQPLGRRYNSPSLTPVLEKVTGPPDPGGPAVSVNSPLMLYAASAGNVPASTSAAVMRCHEGAPGVAPSPTWRQNLFAVVALPATFASVVVAEAYSVSPTAKLLSPVPP